MEPILDPENFTQELAHAVSNLEEVVLAGRDIAERVTRVYMVSCGAGLHVMQGIAYWSTGMDRYTRYQVFSSADFITRTPWLDNQTLVLFYSKSGNTPETLDAVEHVKGKVYKTVVFTQSLEATLATHADQTFCLGSSRYAFLASFMLMQTYVGAIWEKREGWGLLEELVTSLRAFPKAVASAGLAHDARGVEVAERYKEDNHFYFVAAGPGELVSNAFGHCVQGEMLHHHIHDVRASDFFHFTLEEFDETTPIILILTEDPSRSLMERVQKFCEKHAKRVTIYDARDFKRGDISEKIWQIVGPYFVEAALKRLTYHLSNITGMSLSHRRYMGSTKY